MTNDIKQRLQDAAKNGTTPMERDLARDTLERIQQLEEDRDTYATYVAECRLTNNNATKKIARRLCEYFEAKLVWKLTKDAFEHMQVTYRNYPNSFEALEQEALSALAASNAKSGGV